MAQARKATKALTKQCAKEVYESMKYSGPQADAWEHIADYVDCGPIHHNGKTYNLNGDDVYDAVQDLVSAENK